MVCDDYSFNRDKSITNIYIDFPVILLGGVGPGFLSSEGMSGGMFWAEYCIMSGRIVMIVTVQSEIIR